MLSLCALLSCCFTKCLLITWWQEHSGRLSGKQHILCNTYFLNENGRECMMRRGVQESGLTVLPTVWHGQTWTTNFNNIVLDYTSAGRLKQVILRKQTSKMENTLKNGFHFWNCSPACFTSPLSRISICKHRANVCSMYKHRTNAQTVHSTKDCIKNQKIIMKT